MDTELDLELPDEDFDAAETDAEREAREGTEVVLDENDAQFVDRLVDKLMQVTDLVSGHPLRKYQRPFARRFFESLIINDGATLTALFARQALALDTPILTPGGWSTMGDLQPGSRVYAQDGTVTEVTAVSPVFTKNDCYTFRLSDGQEFTADDNHRWEVLDRKSRTTRVMTTGEMLREGVTYDNNGKQCYRFRIVLPEPVQLPEREQPINPYVFGAWLGDGSSYKAELTTADWEIEQAFKEAGYTPTYRYDRGAASTTGFTGGLYAALKTLGVIGRKFIPEDYLLGSARQREALLQGLMDTDGYVDTRGNVEFTSTNRNLAEGVLFLARSLGWKATLKEKRATLNGKDCGPKFEVYWRPYRSDRYTPFRLERKLARTVNRPVEWRAARTETVAIVAIEAAESVPVKCITVAHESHLYLAGHGLAVTHNTGKSETVANVTATAMIMLPLLARAFPDWLGKYEEGVWVGAFAPVDEQADTLFGRIVARLSSDSATAVMNDPDVNARITGRGRSVYVRFLNSSTPLIDGKGHSLVRKTTAHPRATIEGRSYHIILLDEAQGADDRVVNKSIGPMGAATNATMVFTGTPTYSKNVFYSQIAQNKRLSVKRGQTRQNHFEVDWREAAKENDNYRKFVLKEMLRLGEDSDEFRLSYRLQWLLDKGMFTTSEKLDNCGDTSMQSLIPAWNRTPVVVGIDCARKQDRTVVTVIYVDWDNPDELGMYHHRILNWLDLEGLDWETQYFRIVEFLSNYRVWKIGIDVGGLGDVVAQRLQVLMPGIEIVPLGSSQAEQTARWTYLRSLIDRRQLVWPAGAKVRRLKIWRRFRQEMEDLEIVFKGPYVLAEAPAIRDAHDDYPDSAAIGCYLTKEFQQEETGTVEVSVNPFYEHHTRSRYLGR